MHGAGTTGSAEITGIPCAMVLTAYNVLSWVNGLSCHPRRVTPKHHRRLDPSVAGSGPHALARPPRPLRPACVKRAPEAKASIAPRPAFRDDARRPSGWDGMRA